ncbi:MAG: hypothetical protein OXG08_07490 [Gammaproteobacteria bacterium]|nr:hypothetical protein [Gammaproteobacteria bacterium]
MTIVQTTAASALEAAIRARIAIDPQARNMVRSLDGKAVELRVDDTRMVILFERGQARVSSRTEAIPDLTLTGSVVDIARTLLSNNATSVVIEGDENLMDTLHRIFKPSLDTQDVAEQARATAEYGVATARSALEGLASELTTNKADHARIADLAEQLSRLRTTVNDLEDRIKALEDR